MTRLLLNPDVDLDDVGTGPVTLTATLLEPDPITVRMFAVADATTDIELPAPTASQAWRLTVRRAITTTSRWTTIPTTTPGPIVEERTVKFSGATVAWAALTDVDPATLATATAPGNAWQASLDALAAQVNAQAPVALAQAAYDALATKNPSTLYLITG